jgi:hypothetical protein
MSTGAETLQEFFPATSRPLICNAPMAFATNAPPYCEIHSVSTIMSTGAETLQEFFPATSRPLICNAPMAFATNARMAVAVTKAGGLGTR